MHALLLALAPFLPATDGAPAPAPAIVSAAAVEFDGGVTVHLEGTRLVAVSRSLEPFVLVLASPGRGALVARTIEPGAILVASHPPHALTGLWLELLTAPGGRIMTSGALALDGLEQTLVFAASAETGFGVKVERALARGGSVLSRANVAYEPAPLHVPIPSPGNQPPGGTPPPVEKEPVPPV